MGVLVEWLMVLLLSENTMRSAVRVRKGSRAEPAAKR
jgi:hypothetical protein